MSDKMKVAIYCRVGSEDQLALDTQREKLYRFTLENGYGNAEVYADNGYNGLDFDRPAFSKLEADLRAGNVGTVIVRDISRISRDSLAALRWANRLANSGVAFIEADEPRLCQENFLENLRDFVEQCGKDGGHERKNDTGRGICHGAFGEQGAYHFRGFTPER